MLIDEYVKIRVNNKNINNLIKKGYTDLRNNEFIDVKVSDLTDKSHVKVNVSCDICGANSNIRYSSYTLNISKYNIYTCHSCSIFKLKKTNLNKIGVEFPAQCKEVREKQIKTNLERYGVRCNLQLDQVRDKAIATSKTSESKAKRIKTYLHKYGFDNPSKNKLIKDKIRQTNLDRYGVEYPAQLYEIRDKYYKSILNNIINNYNDLNIVGYNKSNFKYEIICDVCENKYEINNNLIYYRYNNSHTICTICNNPIDNHCSFFEGEVFDFIKSFYSGEIIRSYKYSGKKEIDIYIPELSIAIECNGVFWHSEKFKHKNYHLDKHTDLKKSNIELINIWEDDWMYNREIVKSILFNKFKISNKIYARKTKVSFISDVKLVKDFLNKNHIQGYSPAKYNIGLFQDGNLISTMSFSKKRQKMELVRYSILLNHTIIGGASKLFNFFINNIECDEILTYADNSLFKGDVYLKMGFKKEHMTKPNYWWVVNSIRKHRFNFSKQRLFKIYGRSDKTEYEIMSELGHYRIFGVGLTKYSYKKNKI